VGRIDKAVFERRGARGCSNSDYDFLRTSCCSAWCVEDSELSDLYIDPNDLTDVLSLLGAPGEKWVVCPLCGSETYDLLPVDPAEVVPDEWQWAIYRV
jgi:hypothetical protein